MGEESRSYFLVPKWKDEDWTDEIRLGNVIGDVSAPESHIFEPIKHVPEIKLDKPEKEMQAENFKRGVVDDKKTTFGLFAKLLELFGFGLDASHSNTDNDSDKYVVKELTLHTFRPTDGFLENIAKQPAVHKGLNEGDARVFLITGLIIAKGITYTSKSTDATENKGSFGIKATWLNFGPSGSRTRTSTQDYEVTYPGPTLLAFRVQKIQYDENKKPVASPYDGNFYDGDEDSKAASREKKLGYNVKFDPMDEAGLKVIPTFMDIADDNDGLEESQEKEEGGEGDCVLLVPKRLLKKE